MGLARNYTTHWHTRPEKNKMIWFRPAVGETCPCTSVQHGAIEPVSTYLNAFVCSAVVGRVCQCKISAKYWCSVTTALGAGLRPLACWDCGYEYRRGHGCISVLSVVYCQVEFSELEWSLVQGTATECGVCNWVWSLILDNEDAMVY
jgi:hypothetical protein